MTLLFRRDAEFSLGVYPRITAGKLLLVQMAPVSERLWRDISRHFNLRGKVNFYPLYCRPSSGDSLRSVLRKRSMIIMSSAGKSGGKNKP